MRLTEKLCNGEYLHSEASGYSTEICLDKLGQLEDIEELCTKVTEQPFFEKRDNGEIMEMDCYTDDKVLYNFKTRQIEFYDWELDYWLDIDKYGKTWALTREELEHE